MNEQKNDKWLDELISRTINTEKPQFDAEKWKQKFPDEFQALQSRATDKSARSSKRPTLLKNPVIKFAAAAVIIVAIGLFIIPPGPEKKTDTADATEYTKSPAEMLTLRSLKIAYLNGGIEAVEIQCDNAIEKISKRPERITFQELLEDIDGV
jgi:hypothetical protein